MKTVNIKWIPAKHWASEMSKRSRQAVEGSSESKGASGHSLRTFLGIRIRIRISPTSPLSSNNNNRLFRSQPYGSFDRGDGKWERRGPSYNSNNKRKKYKKIINNGKEEQ